MELFWSVMPEFDEEDGCDYDYITLRYGDKTVMTMTEIDLTATSIVLPMKLTNFEIDKLLFLVSSLSTGKDFLNIMDYWQVLSIDILAASLFGAPEKYPIKDGVQSFTKPKLSTFGLIDGEVLCYIADVKQGHVVILEEYTEGDEFSLDPIELLPFEAYYVNTQRIVPFDNDKLIRQRTKRLKDVYKVKR
jgi:hypothetical protein